MALRGFTQAQSAQSTSPVSPVVSKQSTWRCVVLHRRNQLNPPRLYHQWYQSRVHGVAWFYTGAISSIHLACITSGIKAEYMALRGFTQAQSAQSTSPVSPVVS